LAVHSRSRADAGRSSSTRERILDAADFAFYNNGIPLTAIDDIVREAGVSRRAFARSFASKEDVVVAYIARRHEIDVSLFNAIVETGLLPELVLNTVLSEVIADVATPTFHGCAFINAAVECRQYAGVQAAVKNHRDWYVAVATKVLRDAGHAYPADAADELLLVRDGAMNSVYGGDPIAATAALRRAIDRVLSELSDADRPVFS
jgi:AcrR family transcriptional regulator